MCRITKRRLAEATKQGCEKAYLKEQRMKTEDVKGENG